MGWKRGMGGQRSVARACRHLGLTEWQTGVREPPQEGKEAAASEMADVLYHAMVLLNKQRECALACASRRMLPSSSC
jgi:hypothetical protein